MSNRYKPVAKTTSIKAETKFTVKVKDNYYSFLYGEERTIPEGEYPDLEEERSVLFDDCTNAIFEQIELLKEDLR